MGWSHPSGSNSCSSILRSANVVKGIRKQALNFPPHCSVGHAPLLILSPLTPSKDLRVHPRVTLSVDLSPSLAQTSFLPKGFHTPLCKHSSFSSVLILHHSCFCKELSLLEPREIFEDWGHTLVILALKVPNRGAEKKLVIEGSKTFLNCHKYSVPMYSCSHRLIHRVSIHRACCFPFSLFSVPRTDNRPVDH